MPYCAHGDVRLHYEVAGDAGGPPLVLQHGLGDTLQVWHEAGYVAALGTAYRLILLDARGHGLSDKPHDPNAYRTALRAGDVTAVLDDLGIEQAHFFGYSMGGLIGYSLAMHALDRCRSLIIGGQTPREAPPEAPHPLRTLALRGSEAWVEAIPGAFGRWATPALLARARQADTAALAALLSVPERRGFVEALPRMDRPCLLFAGDADPIHDVVRDTAARLPRARFASLPGLTHIEGFWRADLVLPVVTAFLAEVA